MKELDYPTTIESTVSIHKIDGLINNYRDIDKMLMAVNETMSKEDIISGEMRTIFYFKQKITSKRFAGKFLYLFVFLYHRVFPKLNKLFNKIYISATNGKNQHLSKTEIIGRLIRNGFDIKEVSVDAEGLLKFEAVKKRAADSSRKPSFWPVFRMRRIGKDGKYIFVYKLRTMHPYAEFAQEYIKQQHGLEDSGKFMNDFRITSWGRVLRKCWLDELPMVVNLIKGDIKLVGVRPISEGYLKLYPEEFREFRNQFKPGLIPPFYADMPKSFDAIVASENKYLLAYQQNRFRTDLKYLGAIFRNIFIKRARSK